MVSRLGRYLSYIRDAVVTAVSVVLVVNVWNLYGGQGGADVIYAMGGVFIALSVLDVALLVRGRENRKFFLGNAIYQLFPSFFIAGVASVGLLMLTLNVLVVFMLLQKEPPEAQPPQPSAPS